MRRVTYVLAALAALLAGAPAHATTCPLVTDAVGDPGPAAIAPPVPLSHSLDILSADVASGATTVVAMVRVRSLAFEPALAGLPSWSLDWRVGGVRYFVGVHREVGPGGVTWASAFGRAGGPSNVATPVAVDVPNATFTWTMPRSWFPELATPGATFDRFYAFAYEPFTLTSDAAGSRHTTTVTWADGSTGCVPAA